MKESVALNLVSSWKSQMNSATIVLIAKAIVALIMNAAILTTATKAYLILLLASLTIIALMVAARMDTAA